MAATFESGLYAYVSAHANMAAVQALIGTRFYDRGEVPQGPTFPYVTYTRIATNRVHSADGESGLVQALFQLDIWARTHKAAHELADALRLAMSGYSGAMGSFTVRGAILDDERDSPEGPIDSSETGYLSVQQDYRFWHEEGVGF